MMEPTTAVKLTLMESGVLCNLLMRCFVESGGVDKQYPWLIQLYTKLGDANDKLMGKDASRKKP